MRQWVKGLIDIMEDEIRLFEELVELLAKERKVIIEGNISELVEIAKKKETYVVKQKLLEEAKFACLDKAGVRLHNISEIANTLDDEEKEQFIDVAERLRSVVDRAIWENKRNSLLLNKALEINRDLVRIFSPLFSISYGPDGAFSEPKSAGTFRARG